MLASMLRVRDGDARARYRTNTKQALPPSYVKNLCMISKQLHLLIL